MYRKTRRDPAPGVKCVSGEAGEKCICYHRNLPDLHHTVLQHVLHNLTLFFLALSLFLLRLPSYATGSGGGGDFLWLVGGKQEPKQAAGGEPHPGMGVEQQQLYHFCMQIEREI